jgi:peptidoglycan/xylan/chitin deacetylase (PgdA/CDA1 family)
MLRSIGAVTRLKPTARREILLTFDDGPHPTRTPAVLEKLHRYSARAVFFVVGNRTPLAPHVLPLIVEHGHALGNHSYHHDLDREPRPWSYWNDVRRCQDTIFELAGYRSTLYRPPLGRISLSGLLLPSVLRLRTLFWSLGCGDWRLRDDKDAVAYAKKLAAAAQPGDIILLHDDNPCVGTVLDTLLPELTRRDFDLASGVKLLDRSWAR